MEKDIILLWYLMLNIKSEIKLDLLKQYKTEKNIYNNLKDILNNEELSITNRRKFAEVDLVDAQEFYDYLKSKKIGFVTFNQENYPNSFLVLQYPPYGFYYKGDISILRMKKASLVGSRKPSFYGLDTCSRISSFLAKNDVCIVSGLAQGVDSIAHKSALDAGGKSIGVLGCGIEVVYPAGNREIYERMSKQGLIISEFQPFDKPLKHHFPMRNRLISALGYALIVCEATVKSGSLITANHALDIGKPIIAVPGKVDDENFRGCNELIRDGSYIYTCLDDVRVLFGIRDSVNNSTSSCSKNLLMNIIGSEPIHIDDIIKAVNVDRESMFRLLFEMQNTKEIICLPGNFYAKLR